MTSADDAAREKIRRNQRNRDLTGRHVVITGASSGIGRAAAIAVADKGAVVSLLARRGEELAAVVEEIRAAGGSAYGYQCDVTDSESVDQAVKAILDEHGHVDMLVNNAGRSIRRAIHRSTDRLHDFERTMAVNYFGALRMTLALLPQMRERKFGHIVNISSAGVQVATPRFAAYLASKAALDKFTEVAAVETLADGVTFTTIHMPLVRTPMIAPSGNQGPSESPEWAAATIVRALSERPKRIDVPLGTLAEYGGIITPKLRDRILHRYYRALPDSPAARGEQDDTSEPAATLAPPHEPRPRSAARKATGAALRRAARWVPGTHW
ncbi:SDR family NAD(P)-dependent oxidoreductase [Nocardia cyriacigeorgica]|uniref:SDR family NAD(P)-dependent oxidoreductase n=1 Tax=Nocardia cyriacigeorgica TaxID=135487 RepID=UPI0018934132|nr:SDR family NAD(P)-dependent oxidoreductase [Nocardia cyriacigeorgica]MBF6102340.1 SDR family NAD(P)-dependent oxidoreductase [Nocardia cyriacigeorgica]MBF6161264.1 SDR family NAD(P)-dependent oxidoreductase [Nocardia cyriacigeorgica]MBF6200063.1 SDR family NAD(P)-dependent oxidoreductase [Nocardia cyriacigeorgica]MBF6319772.1 SDR family NAD(P)-dependent oxidoreductase [Nocardia cyriacigeorgica]MBF6343828.1 SDR family NAD(P)-dependent oxidoreductase [Nocardia cyriacigeorgica]